jgi:hypothetical protein
MRKFHALAFVASVFLTALPLMHVADAQTPSATVVGACGTPPSTYVVGQQRALTQDTTGKACNAGTVSGTFTATSSIPVAIDNVVDGTTTAMTSLTTTGILYENDNTTGISEFMFNLTTATGTVGIVPQWSNDGGVTWTNGNTYVPAAGTVTNTGFGAATGIMYLVYNNSLALRINLVTCTTCSVAGFMTVKKFPTVLTWPIMVTHWQAAITLSTTASTPIHASCGAGLANYVTQLDWGSVATTVADALQLLDGSTGIMNMQIPAGAANFTYKFDPTNAAYGSAATAMNVQLNGSPTGSVTVNAKGFCGPIIQ